jgi:hypothetical protein
VQRRDGGWNVMPAFFVINAFVCFAHLLLQILVSVAVVSGGELVILMGDFTLDHTLIPDVSLFMLSIAATVFTVREQRRARKQATRHTRKLSAATTNATKNTVMLKSQLIARSEKRRFIVNLLFHCALFVAAFASANAMSALYYCLFTGLVAAYALRGFRRPRSKSTSTPTSTVTVYNAPVVLSVFSAGPSVWNGGYSSDGGGSGGGGGGDGDGDDAGNGGGDGRVNALPWRLRFSALHNGTMFYTIVYIFTQYVYQFPAVRAWLSVSFAHPFGLKPGWYPLEMAGGWDGSSWGGGMKAQEHEAYARLYMNSSLWLEYAALLAPFCIFLLLCYVDYYYRFYNNVGGREVKASAKAGAAALKGAGMFAGRAGAAAALKGGSVAMKGAGFVGKGLKKIGASATARSPMLRKTAAAAARGVGRTKAKFAPLIADVKGKNKPYGGERITAEQALSYVSAFKQPEFVSWGDDGGGATAGGGGTDSGGGGGDGGGSGIVLSSSSVGVSDEDGDPGGDHDGGNGGDESDDNGSYEPPPPPPPPPPLPPPPPPPPSLSSPPPSHSSRDHASRDRGKPQLSKAGKANAAEKAELLKHRSEDRLKQFARLQGYLLCHFVMLSAALYTICAASLLQLILFVATSLLRRLFFIRIIPYCVAFYTALATIQYVLAVPGVVHASNFMNSIGFTFRHENDSAIDSDAMFVNGEFAINLTAPMLHIAMTYLPAIFLAVYRDIFTFSDRDVSSYHRLSAAVKAGDYYLVKEFCRRKLDLVKVVTRRRCDSLLHLAAARGHRRVVKLLSRHVDCDTLNSKGVRVQWCADVTSLYTARYNVP